MKTFTVRELDRQPAVVLDACDREGVARIQRRDGRSYTLRPDNPPARKVPWRRLVAEHRARVARIFPEPLGKEQVRLVDQLIAGGRGTVSAPTICCMLPRRCCWIATRSGASIRRRTSWRPWRD